MEEPLRFPPSAGRVHVLPSGTHALAAERGGCGCCCSCCASRPSYHALRDRAVNFEHMPSRWPPPWVPGSTGSRGHGQLPSRMPRTLYIRGERGCMHAAGRMLVERVRVRRPTNPSTPYGPRMVNEKRSPQHHGHGRALLYKGEFTSCSSDDVGISLLPHVLQCRWRLAVEWENPCGLLSWPVAVAPPQQRVLSLLEQPIGSIRVPGRDRPEYLSHEFCAN